MQKAFALLLLPGLTLPLFGQSNYGVIAGTLMDAQHLAIAGATVQVTALSTGAVRRVVINQQGLVEAPALWPDDYELKTEANGFAAATQLVRLEGGQKLSLEISLNIVGVKEGVNVIAGSEVLRTSDASVGEVITTQGERHSPRQCNPRYWDASGLRCHMQEAVAWDGLGHARPHRDRPHHRIHHCCESSR
jgi:hypothetical protein